jgi:signal transduction histidine kinase
MCLLSIGRYILSQRYHALNPGLDAADRWRRFFLASILVTGMLWLVGAGLLMWNGPDTTRFMVGLALAGMVAGAVPILAPDKLAFRLYAVPILFGVALLNFGYASATVHWVFGILTLVFLGGVLRSSALFNETLEASIRLGLEKSNLVADVEHARKAAEAASQAKSRFLATMSHEIRTPMNGILGMSQLLLQPGVNDDRRIDFARTILTSGQTLLTLLNDILDFSKIEAGRIDLDESAFEPQQVIHETSLLFTEMAARKQLHLVTTCDGLSAHRYLGDSHRLRQMLSNLVSNALKFTERGQIRIEAKEIERDGQRATLEFAVTDTGIGIPADKLHLLFQPFSQADSSTTREYGGTGLGLSIVRSLAELMGGNIGVDSKVGLGSRFWFRIHAGLVDATKDTRHEPRAHSSSGKSPLGSLTGHVLVAEDNPINQKVVTALLGKLGLKVTLVADGVECLESLQRDPSIDLVLMDLQMPNLDGYAATARLRANEAASGRHLPIVALTANAFEEDRRRCLAAGMDDYMAKPVELPKLQALLERWLGSERPA